MTCLSLRAFVTPWRAKDLTIESITEENKIQHVLPVSSNPLTLT